MTAKGAYDGSHKKLNSTYKMTVAILLYLIKLSQFESLHCKITYSMKMRLSESISSNHVIFNALNQYETFHRKGTQYIQFQLFECV